MHQPRIYAPRISSDVKRRRVSALVRVGQTASDQPAHERNGGGERENFPSEA